jgi:hypothetical protein
MNDGQVSYRRDASKGKTHIPLHARFFHWQLRFRLLSTRNRLRRAMHQGCVRSRRCWREGSGGVVADIAKLSLGREACYTRELATDHEQYLSGHGESPGRWYGAGARSLGLEGEASVAGFQACSRVATLRLVSCSAVPTAATPCRPSRLSCGRPRACRSSTGWGTRRPAGRCSPPIMPGWPRRSPTWTSTWGPAVATVVSSTCPDRAAGRRVRPPDVQRR